MIEFIIKTNRLFDKAVYCEIVKLLKEYNIDTSAEPLNNIKGDDIVRYSFEKRRTKDKEP